jgi:hypothetical protein
MCGNIDVTQLKDNLTGLDWNEHNIRQNLGVHRNTETLEVIWDFDSLQTNKIGKIHSNYYKLDMESFLEKMKPIYESNYGEGYFIRVLIVKLKANTNIEPHVDNGYSLMTAKRTHIPIITNSKVTFTVNGETKYLKEGEIWEINNSKVHSVDNNSDEDRIHLIIDYTKSGKKLL